MSLSNLISELFFFYPTLPSFATFVLAARWILYAGPPPNTVKQDLIWLLPIETSLVYNTIALIFLSAYYTEEYVNCHLDIEHLLRLSVHKVACALNLTLVLGYPIWSGLKATTVIVQPLSNPAGVYSWYAFTMYVLAAFVVFFGMMAIVWLGSGVFGDLKKYKRGGANYLATAQTLEKATGSENGIDFLLADVEIVSATKGLVVSRLTVGSNHVNSRGTIHGAVSASLVDWSGGLAIASHGLEESGASIDIHISYIGTAHVGDVLNIEATASKVGRSIAFTTIRISKLVDGQPGPMVATASHTKYLHTK